MLTFPPLTDMEEETMGRHPIDHQAPPEGARLLHFLRIARRERGEGGHPAVQALTRRARGGSARKARAFARIARGARA